MLNGRLYRAAFLPFLLALAIASFSLEHRPAPLTSTLAPDAFEGSRAFAELGQLAGEFPERRPGSAGDERLAGYVADSLRSLGAAGAGGFSVRVVHGEAQTIDGERTLTTVIAERPGSSSASPILILAHRDGAAPGSRAELSGTAALLALARVFAARETKRTIVLASTSGGTGGAGAARELPAQLQGPFDAAIVLGDLAGTATRRPFVVPYSDGLGSAPLRLQRTVADAITHELGASPGEPSELGQLAHLAFPLAVGEQGVLNAAGVPSVLVQATGERGPSAREPVSAERLEGFGRAVLSAVDALDSAPDISASMQTGLLLKRQLMPAWAFRALLGTLLFPVLVALADGLARARRRRLGLAVALAWTLGCALPFLACALLVYLLAALGALGASPPLPSAAVRFDGRSLTVLVALALCFALAWGLRRALAQRARVGATPDPDAAGLTVVLVLFAVCVVAGASNPFAALLVLPASHLWLALSSHRVRRSRAGALALLGLGLLPLAAIIYFYARQLGLGTGELAWSGVLLLSGGQVGLGGVILWSLGLGCVLAGASVALGSARTEGHGDAPRAPAEVTIRGPLSYAGPGSLGGTESALRR